MRDVLEGLNREQREAVTTVEGPLMLIAGAGTGKTNVLIRRVAYLIDTAGVSPDNILAVTFTEKAAAEIKRRIEEWIGTRGEELWVSTFHSFCADVLRKHGTLVGLSENFKQFDEIDQWVFLRRLLPQLHLDYFLELADPYRVIRDFIGFISRAKDELILPEDYLVYARQKQLEFGRTFGIGYGEIEKFLHEDKYIATRPDIVHGRPQEEWLALKEAGLEVKKMLEMGEIYRRYQEEMLNTGSMDFGDLIVLCYRLFKEHPDVLDQYRRRFTHILVDEFQDTNIAQIELLKLLADPRRNICVVGDDDQAIYRFRGASYASFVKFKEQYPDHKAMKLYQNYRSMKRILEASGCFIANNGDARYDPEKNLWTENERGDPIKVLLSTEFSDEAVAVADAVENVVRSTVPHGRHYGECAVLYRAHAHRELITGEFDRRGIPYAVVPAENLMATDVVQEIIAILQTARNRMTGALSDTIPLMRIFSFPRWKILVEDILKILREVNERERSIIDILTSPDASRLRDATHSLTDTTKSKLSELSSLLDQIAQMIHRGKSVLDVVSFIVSTSEYNIPALEAQNTPEAQQMIRAISAFLRFIQVKSEQGQNKTFLNFVEYLDFFVEAGGEIEPVDSLEDKDLDAVRCQTVHSAKGLEFDTVFVVSLTNNRFPTRRRSEAVLFPPELLKESVPSGDVHLQEERRLFYVAMTRARRHLYLSAVDKKHNKRSQFVDEAGLPGADHLEVQVIAHTVPQAGPAPVSTSARVQPSLFPMPEKLRLSFSQIDTYGTCPLKYKFRYVYKIPTAPKAYYVYGDIQHHVLEAFFAKIKRGEKVDGGSLLQLYEVHWREGGFTDTLQQVEYKRRGYTELQEFYTRNKEHLREPVALEENFRITVGGHKVRGRIDRIDKLDDGGVEVIDYKTGRPKGQESADQSMQLSIYAMAVRERFQKDPRKLSFYYLTSNEKVTSSRSDEQLESAKESILAVAGEILARNFKPNKGFHCGWCEFKPICPEWNMGGIN